MLNYSNTSLANSSDCKVLCYYICLLLFIFGSATIHAQTPTTNDKDLKEIEDIPEIELPEFVELPNTSKDAEPFEEETFKVVEKMPRFPGCDTGTEKEKYDCAQSKMLKYIYSNTVYPVEARENDVEGIVVISFIVDKTGELLDIKCIRSIGAGCDEEALRVIESMPNWNPGMQRGKPVKVQFNLPIKFRLEGKKKKKRFGKKAKS